MSGLAPAQGARRWMWGAFALYAAAWIAAAGFLALKQPDDVVDAGVVMAAYGLILPGLTWLLTRGPKPAPTPVARPGPQLIALLVFLALYAVLFTGYGLSAFHAAFPPSRGEFRGLIGLKLAVHVALPVLLLAALGGPLRPLFSGRADRRFWLLLIVIGVAQLGLMMVISHSLADIAALKFTAPMAGLAVMGTFLWMCLEAGFCEEFLFRAVLQSRLAAVTGSEMAAVFFGALLFGLAHAPGLWLRSGTDVAGHASSLLPAMAYAVAVISPTGILMGVVWARTRNLWLLVLLHGLTDALPNAAEFARIWMK